MLVPVFPLTYLVAHNALHDVVATLTGLSVVVLAVVAMAWLTTESVARLTGRVRAAAVVSAASISVLSYGHVYGLLDRFDVRHAVLFPAWSAGTAFVVVGLLIVPLGALQALTRAANVASLLLVTAGAIQVSHAAVVATMAAEARPGSRGVAAAGDRPDIYFVILDAFGSHWTLRDLYGHDPAPFYEALRARGFVVHENAFSNYAFTRLSVAGTLNMRHIHADVQAADDGRNWRTIARLLRQNAVLDFVRARGYRYIHIRSGNDVTDTNPNADVTLGCGAADEFFSTLVQTTALRAVGAERWLADDARARILCQFRQLARVAHEAGPTFVFAHLLIPHPPYVFTADGSARPQPRLALTGDAAWRDRTLYRDQVVFASRQMLTTVDAILRTARTPPVIIIQGDHGPSSLGWSRLTAKVARERMGILAAYHLPGVDPAVVKQGLSPVNIFRVIFNAYFDTQLPLLDDRAYFSTPERPYAVVDVTPWLRDAHAPR